MPTQIFSLNISYFILANLLVLVLLLLLLLLNVGLISMCLSFYFCISAFIHLLSQLYIFQCRRAGWSKKNISAVLFSFGSTKSGDPSTSMEEDETKNLIMREEEETDPRVA